jgi:Fe-Mn family superoxide dismutase
MFKLPNLPYAKTALTPFLNEEQMTFHYDKHHKAYVDNLNKFIEADSAMKGKSLEEIVKTSSGGIFNNAAQIWNHTFYWFCVAPVGKTGKPSDKLSAAIQKDFGSMDELKIKFVDGGMKTFGSGWIWLCSDKSGKLSLVSTSNAQVPFIGDGGLTPLLVADVWEHAYYVDYRNARQKYLETFWNHVNWDFVSENYTLGSLRILTPSMQL